MLDAWIIEKLRQQEETEDRPTLELPLYPLEEVCYREESPEPTTDRGVTVINLLG